MKNIFAISELEQLLNVIKKKKIVLVGGCFDILHIGHITFLEKARLEGDILIALLESDASIKKLKGTNRPVNSQRDRAKILVSLEDVDFVITLPSLDDSGYDDLIERLKPQVIAVTQGDKSLIHKKRQADQIKAKLVTVTPQIADQSTTRVLKLLEEF